MSLGNSSRSGHLLPRKSKSLSHFNVTHKRHKMGTELAGKKENMAAADGGGTQNKSATIPSTPKDPMKSSSPVHRVTSADNQIKHKEDHPNSLSNNNKSNSYVEGKYRMVITSERLLKLRKTMEMATRDHKVFSIRGGWPVIRRELLKRNWLEKVEPAVKQKFSAIDDVTSNLPAKQDWESTQSYEEKCEKTIISRMLQNYDVDFYWSMRKDQCDLQHRANSFKLLNRFSRSLYASKEGLALLLQQSYWYNESGVASINFPRTYVLGFPDHYNFFVDDFRMTACLGLLKWFEETYENGDKHDIQSAEGKVPYATLQFAIDRCNDYIAKQKHLDIDKDLPQIWDHEWEQFLSNYYNIVHQGGYFIDFSESLTNAYANVKSTLKEMRQHWPQYGIDGQKNIWILKPGNKCRGRGIYLVKTITDVDKVMNLKMKYVVQKYIERPLIIYKTKFDIRQWFLVTCTQPLTIWMYRDCYLRFSGQTFSLDNFHESLHLTNHAVQCKYTNMEQRDKALPVDNMWDSHTFKAYLKQIGCAQKWNEIIYPGMQESITCAMLASQDTMDRRQNTFEMYGADFMLSEDFTPWLLELNCSPDLSFSTSVTSKLCPQVMEDIIKVVIDRRKDPNADTGLFDLIYKQNFPRTPPYLGMNLSVRGRKIFRSRSKIKDKEKIEKEKTLMRLRKQDFVKTEFIRDSQIRKMLPIPKTLPINVYKGPVIADFIEDLQKSSNAIETGVDFIPIVRTESNKKKYDFGKINTRVLRCCTTKQQKTTGKARANRNVKESSREIIRSCNNTSNWTNLKLTLEDTASLLKGTNHLIKNKNVFDDFNKNSYKSLNINVFDLNEMLKNIEK
ncbi:tubulin glycylase 3A-like [Diorhabda sublineata]|uniref:tubulin glycylase 3A-like n=1 Tax=Diorhabda sublineata TaxID=1163346 RepID=UPI0024E18D3B|nr:tubulin glycylase 3A-like [Diorhabda sublineata]